MENEKAPLFEELRVPLANSDGSLSPIENDNLVALLSATSCILAVSPFPGLYWSQTGKSILQRLFHSDSARKTDCSRSWFSTSRREFRINKTPVTWREPASDAALESALVALHQDSLSLISQLPIREHSVRFDQRLLERCQRQSERFED